ncbi:SDR family NAD(P)-dependent oxidoreductase [Methanospirillum stamsii]|uniref:Short-chain dehydrogenase n=1 Tax=Methanospirillum stamsii TaxID=1277351 RepID=A0A2V2MTI2_9EURY|nr:SDR family oxidoreductase [Methanospirillum stamsii]PWR69630.1 hypothetical protein DLD82_17305 [Methanospirillum stamsii]
MNQSEFNLSNRIILLTGASGYLGTALTMALCAAGAEIIMVGRSEERLIACKNLVSSVQKEKCHIFCGDIVDINTIQELKKYIQKKYGRIHGIVNNAYSGKSGELSTIVPEDFFLACQYNLLSPFFLVKELIPLLIRGYSDTGVFSSVVNISSMYGTVSPDPSIYGSSGENNPIHYGATKAGLIQMTRYLACHLSQQGIRFNCISPGPFPNRNNKCNIPNFYKKLADKVPMNRVGEPHEVCGPVVFLLSNASSYVNGVNLPVDGGWTAW